MRTTHTTGVIDHNEFINNWMPEGGSVRYGYGVSVSGNIAGGAKTPPFGSGETVFIEDNFFSGNKHGITASANNTSFSYVARNNTFEKGAMDVLWLVDMHAPDLTGSGDPRLNYEIYNNTIRNVGTAIGILGGDGVIFNNTLSGAMLLRLEYASLSGTCEQYPCRGQIRDTYIWNNTPQNIVNESPDFIKAGRDYYQRPRPGYTPYTYPHPLVTGTSPTPTPTPSTTPTPTPTPPPVVTLSVAPLNLTFPGQSLYLVWSAQNATSCTASNACRAQKPCLERKPSLQR